MADSFMALWAGLDPWFIVAVLTTFALVMLWFKRRTVAEKLPGLAGDFLTRHVKQPDRGHPYKG